jgi:hypothetical protein
VTMARLPCVFIALLLVSHYTANEKVVPGPACLGPQQPSHITYNCHNPKPFREYIAGDRNLCAGLRVRLPSWIASLIAIQYPPKQDHCSRDSVTKKKNLILCNVLSEGLSVMTVIGYVTRLPWAQTVWARHKGERSG